MTLDRWGPASESRWFSNGVNSCSTRPRKGWPSQVGARCLSSSLVGLGGRITPWGEIRGPQSSEVDMIGRGAPALIKARSWLN